MTQFGFLRERINRSQHISEILSGTSRSLFTKLTGLLFAYLFSFAVARFFNAEAWGMFSLALSLIAFSAILGSAGIDLAMLKISASQNDKKNLLSVYRTAFIVISGLSLFFSLAAFLLSEWIANSLFNNTELAPVFRVASFGVFPYCLLNLNARILQGLKKINKYVFIRFVSHHLAALLLLVILYLFWKQNQIILYAYVGGLYLILCLSFIWLKKESIQPFKSRVSGENTFTYSLLLKMSMPLLFANTLIFFKGWMDTIMVGFFMTEHDVGVYNIALKISGLLLFVLTSVNAVIAPSFSKLFSQNKLGELQSITLFSTSLIFYATLPLFLILIIFPEQILSIFGSEFMLGKDVLIILSIGSFLSAIAGSVGYLMQMTDSQHAFQNITLIAAVTGFILNLYLIPHYGIEGAAISTCITMIFWNGLCVFYIKYKYNILTAYVPFLRRRNPSDK